MSELKLRNAQMATLRRRAVEWRVTDGQSQISIQNRLEAVNDAWAHFQTNHEILLASATTDAAETAHVDLFLEIQDVYMNLKEVLGTAIASVEPTPTVTTTSATVRPLKLNPVKIPKFDGNPLNWLEFRETFEALVHRQEMESIEKLAVLRDSVCAIKVPMVGGRYTGGYEEVWSELCRRYDNKRWLAETQAQRLFSLPTVRDTQEGLRSMVDEVSLIVRALRQMGLDMDGAAVDVLMVNTVLPKLPETVRSAWGLQLTTPEIPRLTDLLDYINLRANNQPCGSSGPAARQNSHPPRVRANVGTTTSNRRPGCLACQEHHPVWRCRTFKGLSVADRTKLIREQQRCENCFGDHRVGDCGSQRRCLNCQAKHNSILCPQPRRNSSSVAPTQAPSIH